MNKKIITFLIVIIVLLIGFITLNQSKQKTSIQNSDMFETIDQNNVDLNSDQTQNSVINTPSQQTVSSTSSNTTCIVNYDTTEESNVVFEENPALITKVEKKCDGNYYVTVDYLGPSVGDPEAGNGEYYTNTNLRLRTFKVSSNIQVEIQGQNVIIPIIEYLENLVLASGNSFGRFDALIHPRASSVVNRIQVQNGVIVSLLSVYLP